MRRNLTDKVVVVTGASSGIGRATAVRLARRGASVVLVARREEPLEELAAGCRTEGVRALVCPADVSSLEEMEGVARRAAAELGGIDAWVNAAGVFVSGDIERMPPDLWRRVIETNLFGVYNGARAVLPYLRARGSGAIVNVASLYGVLGGPKVTAYSSSKFAVRGFSEALRIELRGTNIDVCSVLPASVDTPIWQHAGNYEGRRLRPMEPIYSAERVARAIVSCLERPRREVIVGLLARFFVFAHTVAPSVAEAAVARMVKWRHFEDVPVEPTAGIAFEPMAEGTETGGGWKWSPRTRALIAAAAVPTTLAALGLGWRQRRA